MLRVCHTRVKHNQNMSHQLCHKKIIFSFIFNPGDESGGAAADVSNFKIKLFPQKTNETTRQSAYNLLFELFKYARAIEAHFTRIHP